MTGLGEGRKCRENGGDKDRDVTSGLLRSGARECLMWDLGGKVKLLDFSE